MRLSLGKLAGVAGSAALALAVAGQAVASEAFTDTNVTKPTLAVNAKGEALVTYVRTSGAPRRILAWGALNANPSTDPAVAQIRFKFDYAGGWGKYRAAGYWQTFRNACAPYDGPQLAYFVAGCRAPDGSYWALQSWQRMLPLLGFDPWKPDQTAFELHLSHWNGELAKLEVYRHWTYDGEWQGLFGRLSYAGSGVHGFGSTSVGNPKDRYGRNIYIDTFNSAYGAGWKRESGILLHKPTGTFCHSFVPQKPFPNYPSQAMRPPAPGERYRATVMGPGVTPIVQWEGPGLTASDRGEATTVASVWDDVMGGDRICAPERS